MNLQLDVNCYLHSNYKDPKRPHNSTRNTYFKIIEETRMSHEDMIKDLTITRSLSFNKQPNIQPNPTKIILFTEEKYHPS